MSPSVGFLVLLLLRRAGTGFAPAIVWSYAAAILVTAAFHLRYVRAQREFLVTRTPWRDFILISLGEWATCAVTAAWIVHRVRDPHLPEALAVSYGAATLVRYVLRKELMQDIRGLRKDRRREEVTR